jgi:hypothetical protein
MGIIHIKGIDDPSHDAQVQSEVKLVGRAIKLNEMEMEFQVSAALCDIMGKRRSTGTD